MQHAGTHNFEESHQWETARRLLEQAGCDEERAIVLGFASHLLVGIIAHNHFVPAHEKLWVNVPLLPHLAHDRVRLHTRRQIYYYLPLPSDLFLEGA